MRVSKSGVTAALFVIWVGIVTIVQSRGPAIPEHARDFTGAAWVPVELLNQFRFHQVSPVCWQVADLEGQGAGWFLVSDEKTAAAGYKGPVGMVLFINGQLAVERAFFGENEESARSVRKIERSDFLSQWAGKSLKSRHGADAVSGATVTSRAANGTIQQMLEQFSQWREEGKKKTQNGVF